MFDRSPETVTIEHVTVLERTSLTLTCHINDQSVKRDIAMIERSSTILDGHATYGTLVIARWRAEELGLLDSAAPK